MPFTGALNIVGERTPGREAGGDQMRNDKPLPIKLSIPQKRTEPAVPIPESVK